VLHGCAARSDAPQEISEKRIGLLQCSYL